VALFGKRKKLLLFGLIPVCALYVFVGIDAVQLPEFNAPRIFFFLNACGAIIKDTFPFQYTLILFLINSCTHFFSNFFASDQTPFFVKIIAHLNYVLRVFLLHRTFNF